jgi:hypothetical protein
MKRLFCSLTVLTILLSACAPAGHETHKNALWDKYNAHCLEHARTASTTGSPDEEAQYRECMDYFVKTEIECSYCVVKK